MSQPCPILVINLERSIDRLANMRLQLDRLGLTFDLVRAVKASANEAAGSRHNHFLGEYFADLTPGEQACRESHLLALRAVANSHDRAVLVLEDDAEVGPAAVAALSHIITGNPGNRFMFAVLAASASYIAVPAAMRLAVPKADPGLYIPMALGVTFPMNITVGMPLYEWVVMMS